MIDHQRQLIFIHIARTGGTSIESALIGNDWWSVEPQSKHLSASQTRKYYGDEIWNTYSKFTVVRNPWDRVISMWATGWWENNSQDPSFDKVMDGDLETFILQLKPHSHEIYGTLFYHEILDEKVDFVLRFENLVTDFNNMMTALDLPKIKLPHVEKRERSDYHEYYDGVTEALVRSTFQRDIELFAYEY